MTISQLAHFMTGSDDIQIITKTIKTLYKGKLKNINEELLNKDIFSIFASDNRIIISIERE